MEFDFDKEYLLYKSNELALFKRCQNMCWEILLQIHKICEKNKIWYCLAYGSLLGAVRHNGMIPWDYDIDIWVDFDQRDLFIESLEKELSSNIKIYTRLKDKNCRHNIMRLTPDGYDSEVLHVDVFWMHKGIDNIHKIKKINEKFTNLRNIAFWKKIDLKYITDDSKISKIWNTIYKGIYKLIPMGIVDKSYRMLSDKFQKKGNYWTDEYFVLDSNNFKNLILHKMCDGSYLFIPSGYKELLSDYYGDWQLLPEVEQRVREMENSLKRIKKFNYKNLNRNWE